ncbi:hypothetical protein A6D6_02675 [Alcanivorax xiamenensis]|uniref:SMODS and SLOG-associating 2TM effector domain-containing protein n=1 Tax=Alcanivorax xiamenensis TaxID=1177156 RepID=A0ABQ6Y6D3_9GAMM|nr:hypothetical protein [Alcanivorax xiamenensis]KAF0804911.1 hypothetical protein A6D6_02675 [Alcanivorax xiamenensis]
MDQEKAHEIEFRVRWGRRYNERYARIFRRLHGALYAIQLAGAFAGIAAFFKKSPDLASSAGLIIAVAIIMDIVLKPAEKAAIASSIRGNYLHLFRERKKLTPDEIESEISRLQEKGELADIECLRNLVHNEVLLEMGYGKKQFSDYRAKVSVLGKLAKIVA